MSAPRCTKCDTMNHRLFGCELKPWPHWETQLCDRCGERGHETGKDPCAKKSSPLMMACDHCGHEGHHYTTNCKIKEWRVEENRNQYTKTKFVAATDRVNAAKNAVNNPPQNLNPGAQGRGRGGPAGQRGRADGWGGRAGNGRGRGGQGYQMGTQNPSQTGLGQNHQMQNLPARVSPFAQRPDPPHVQNALAASISVLTVTSPQLTRAQRIQLRETRKKEREAREKMQEENRKKWAAATLKLTKFPTRPITPSNSAPQHVANFFRVTFRDQGPEIRRYVIQLGKVNNNDPKKRELRRYLITSMLDAHPPDATVWACDYYSTIVSVGKLYNAMGDDAGSSILDVPHMRTPGPRDPPAGVIVETKIKYEGLLNKKNLLTLINLGVVADVDYSPDDDLKALNIISCKAIQGNDFLGGRVSKKFYLPDETDGSNVKTISQSGRAIYHLRSGFYSSMRPGDRNLLLNVNVSTSAFFSELPLDQWIRARWGVAVPQSSVRHELIGVSVVFEGDDTGQNGQQRMRIIRGFDNLTVAQYINSHPGAIPTDRQSRRDNTTVACVNLASVDEPVWYASDKLKIAPWQVVRGKLDPMFTDAMLKFAKNNPAEARNLIMNKARSPLQFGPGSTSTTYSDFGLKVEPDFLPLRIRSLQQPTLEYKSHKQILTNNGATQRAAWNLHHISSISNKGFLETCAFCGLKAIRITEQGSGSTLEQITDFCKKIQAALRNYGLSAPADVTPDIKNAPLVTGVDPRSRRKAFDNNLDVAWDDLNRPSLVIVILPRKDATMYADIKSWGDCLRGVLTICVTPSIVTKGLEDNATVFANLSLKVNVKLRGTNHKLDKKFLLDLLKPHTMIVGADVTHTGKGADPTCPSLAGVVATRDANCVQYFPSARLQSKNTEYLEDLKGMMYERLLAYREYNQRLPSHILFYRDGVSESQYGMVREEELREIKAGCTKAANEFHSAEPAVTLVVVGKRHHARFYTQTLQAENPEPGIIVDHTAVAPNYLNFYLQSHYAKGMGTLRTGHYVVITNGSNYSVNVLQQITHNLCFLSSRATKGLSVCTPARYADTLCDRLRFYMRPALEGKLESHDQALDNYKIDSLIWGNEGGRLNPWHPKLDDVMFYL